MFDWLNNSEEVLEENYEEKGSNISLRYINEVPLNEKREDIKSNFLECKVRNKSEKTIIFSWVISKSRKSTLENRK